MRLQDQIVKQTQKALDDVLRAVEAIPEDKRSWKPADTARSAIDQMDEIANFPELLYKIVAEGEMPDFGNDPNINHHYDSYEEAKREALERNSKLCKAISMFPDSELEQEITLPFVGGLVMTMADVLGLQHWNLTYHHGQLNYIQTLLGDTAMH